MMHILDCDGVILRTNASKSRAFCEAAIPYGVEAAREMVRFHQSAGSISRKARWEHFFVAILGREPESGELERVIADCTARVIAGAREAEVMPGLREFLAGCGAAIVVSGVTTDEVRELLAHHGLGESFAGVYGGPRRKREILRRLVREGTIETPATYYGDTLDDYQAAVAAGLDFVFVKGDTEWQNWRGHFASRPEVRVIEDFRELAEELKPRVTETVAPRKAWVGPDGFAYIRGTRERYVGRGLAGATVML